MTNELINSVSLKETPMKGFEIEKCSLWRQRSLRPIGWPEFIQRKFIPELQANSN